ncbi:MAG: GNAT family protein [Candidatus Woesearchaeota archaeon]|jgi:RimJ/RimL family protein N-acetyltransferase
MILQTKNLTLDSRPLKYIDALYELIKEDNKWLSTWTVIAYPAKKKEVRTYYNEEIKYKNELFVILTKEKEVMGMISLHKNTLHNNATIGYWLGLYYRNKGYMTEATLKVIEYGFSTLQLMRIEISTAEQNAPSLSVINKCNFHFEGVRRMGVRNGFNQYYNLKVYSILREEFNKK